jgi:hypothetical protein
VNPLLDAIPVKDLSVAFRAKADPRTITLSDGQGDVHLSNHELAFDLNGDFKGRTFESDTSKPNGYRATATLRGDINRPGQGSTKIDEVDVELSGKHRVKVPFNDLEKVEVEASLKAKARARLSDLDVGAPGAPRIRAESATASFDGEGTLVLRPYTGNPDDKKELTISRDSRYALKVEGPVRVSGLKADGVTLPETVTINPVDGKPVVELDGDFGTKMGFVFVRTNMRLEGVTNKRGIASLVQPDGTYMSTTLRPGARVSVKAYTFAGIKKDTLKGGGVRVTGDVKISGEGENTTLEGKGFAAELPGVTEINLRAATNTRYGTRNGKELQVRSLAVGADLTLKEGKGTVYGESADGLNMELGIAPGTRFEATSGLLRRSKPTALPLETDGFKKGERTAGFKAHLVLAGGSLSHKGMVLGFQGRSTIDLDAALGFKFDPKAMQEGKSAVTESVPVDLNLAIDFAQDSTISFAQKGNEAKVRLSGATRFTLHTEVSVDPVTGKPTLKALDGIDVTIEAEAIDLKTMLAPLGKQLTASIGSRTTIRIAQARVEFTPQGLLVHHNGVSFSIAAGTIAIKTGN